MIKANNLLGNMSASIETVQKNLAQEISTFSTIQKSYQKLLQTRQQLEAQLTENNIVKEV